MNISISYTHLDVYKRQIMNGGRYDKLMNHFQRQVPAIGFSYDLSHILKALEKEEEA